MILICGCQYSSHMLINTDVSVYSLAVCSHVQRLDCATTMEDFYSV